MAKYLDDTGAAELNQLLAVKFAETKVAFGTCTTAAATAQKAITISDANFKLKKGTVISVYFTKTNTAENPTFKVNNETAHSVYYHSAVVTTASLTIAGSATTTMNYVFDGTYFVYMGKDTDSNTTYTNLKLGQGYGTCATEAATVAKVVTMTDYTLTANGIVVVKFTYDVPADATMNINGKGAKAIYYQDAAITAGIICAGDIASFIYNDSKYKLIAVDKCAEAEETSNKITSISSSSTDIQYPSAKCTYDNLALKQNKVTYSTTDLTPGVSTLAEGELYFVYE